MLDCFQAALDSPDGKLKPEEEVKARLGYLQRCSVGKKLEKSELIDCVAGMPQLAWYYVWKADGPDADERFEETAVAYHAVVNAWLNLKTASGESINEVKVKPPEAPVPSMSLPRPCLG